MYFKEHSAKLKLKIKLKKIFVVSPCTDGNTVFRCDSDKNSLVIISMF